MKIKVLPDDQAVAMEAASVVAAQARAAIAERGRFLAAFSGGSTPWIMLRALAGEDVPWEGVHIFQVDERGAPDGSPARNLTHLRESLLARVPLPPDQVHPMPVGGVDLPGNARRYQQTLHRVAGSPPILDLVHLGLGPDGHTASLVPGDAVLNVTDSDVAVSGPYQGTPRLTLTFPMINRARRILWLVTGAEKAGMLARLRAADPAIPAGRVRPDATLVLADRAAAAQLESDRNLESHS
jgi:6-phosphogluconolactonase